MRRQNNVFANKNYKFGSHYGILTELTRRYPVYGGIIAALPLISILSTIG